MFVEKTKYFNWLKRELNDYFKNKPNVRVFLFGGSTKRERFGDIDIALDGAVRDDDTRRLKALFEASTFPYFVDVVNFSKASEKFKRNVMSYPILWIKR